MHPASILPQSSPPEALSLPFTMSDPFEVPELVTLVKSAYSNAFLRSVDPQTTKPVDYQALTQTALDNIVMISKRFNERVNDLPSEVNQFEFATCFRANVFYRFREDLLPSLRDKINLFCDGLAADRTNASADPHTFQSLHEKLSELEKILTQIFSSITSLYDLAEVKVLPSEVERPCSPIEEIRMAEPLNAYPWPRVTLPVLALADQCQSTFKLMRETMNLGDLVQANKSEENIDHPVVDLARTISIKAEDLIETLSESDFQYFSKRCQKLITKISQDCIARIYKLINSGLEFIFIDHRQYEDSFGVCLLNTSRLHTFIPILKLARLFLNKLSKRGSIVSKMTMSHQSQLLASVEAISEPLTEFVKCKAWLDHNDNPIWMQTFFLKTMSTFAKPLEILSNHFDHLSTEYMTTSDLIENRKAQDWCLMWAEQFDLAVNSFRIAFYEKFWE